MRSSANMAELLTEGFCGILLTGNDWAAGLLRMESDCGEWRGVGPGLGEIATGRLAAGGPRTGGWWAAVPGLGEIAELLNRTAADEGQ